MRQKVNAEQLERFMKEIGRVAKNSARIYLVGGSTAVLLGWRDSTIDIDLKMVPEVNEVLRRIAGNEVERVVAETTGSRE